MHTLLPSAAVRHSIVNMAALTVADANTARVLNGRTKPGRPARPRLLRTTLIARTDIWGVPKVNARLFIGFNNGSVCAR